MDVPERLSRPEPGAETDQLPDDLFLLELELDTRHPGQDLTVFAQRHYGMGPKELAFVDVQISGPFGPLSEEASARRKALRSEARVLLEALGYAIALTGGRDVNHVDPWREPLGSHARLERLAAFRVRLEQVDVEKDGAWEARFHGAVGQSRAQPFPSASRFLETPITSAFLSFDGFANLVLREARIPCGMIGEIGSSIEKINPQIAKDRILVRCAPQVNEFADQILGNGLRAVILIRSLEKVSDVLAGDDGSRTHLPFRRIVGAIKDCDADNACLEDIERVKQTNLRIARSCRGRQGKAQDRRTFNHTAGVDPQYLVDEIHDVGVAVDDNLHDG